MFISNARRYQTCTVKNGFLPNFSIRNKNVNRIRLAIKLFGVNLYGLLDQHSNKQHGKDVFLGTSLVVLFNSTILHHLLHSNLSYFPFSSLEQSHNLPSLIFLRLL